jgi:DNA-binding GntR family transcriptional regulator
MSVPLDEGTVSGLGTLLAQVGPQDSLSDAVYQTLRLGLETGLLSAGTRVIEADIASQLNVSRTPVREAFRRLQSEGFVRAQKRGIIVEDILQDAEVSFMMRQRLEGLAAYRAALNLSAPELDELRAIQEEMEAVVGGSDDTRELVRLNAAFHDRINRAASSDRLERMIDQLAPMYISRQVILLYDSAARVASVEHHRLILDALWRRDHREADRLVSEHISMGMKVVLQYLRERQEAQ